MSLSIDNKKYLVIGTSNSIVNGGWFDAFYENINIAVERVALGGAPFTQFFSKLNTIDLSVYELVILECSPNDESYSDKVGFSWFFDTLYQNFLSTITQHTNLLVLRVPALPFIKSPSNVWKRQVKILSNLNIPFYDFTDSLLESNTNSDDVSFLYRDKYHPLTKNMNNAGKLLADWLLKNELPKATKTSPSFKVYTQKVISSKKSKILNSLVDEEFNILSIGESMSFSVPGVCIGFYIDAGHSWGCLKLHGLEDEISYSFVFFDPVKNKGHMKFVPIKNGFYLKAISLVMPYKSVDYALHSNVPLNGSNNVAFGDFVFLSSN